MANEEKIEVQTVTADVADESMLEEAMNTAVTEEYGADGQRFSQPSPTAFLVSRSSSPSRVKNARLKDSRKRTRNGSRWTSR